MPHRELQSPSALGRPGQSEAMSTLEFYRELFAQAEGRPYVPPPPAPEPAPVRPLSTVEFYKQLFAPKSKPEPTRPLLGTKYDGRISGGRTVEEYCRQLAAERTRSEGPALRLGPRPGLFPPALPAGCRGVRGGDRLLSWVLAVRPDGRVLAKQERAAGRVADFAYEYDPRGHLLRAWRDGRLAEEYVYDARAIATCCCSAATRWAASGS